MRTKCILAAGAAAFALLAAGSAGAATFSVAGDFGSSVFAYGQGVGGSSFTAFSSHTACGAGLDCYDTAGLPDVVKNTNAFDVVTATALIQAGTVHLHPGPAASGNDAIVRFIAPTAGLYRIAGAFAREDMTANGNGTVASIWSNIGGAAASLFSTSLPNSSYGSETTFKGLTANLGAGDSIDFVLNNAGEYSYDSTRLSATLTLAPTGGVPEPASWAMLIAGFFGLGQALRQRAAAAL
jgi:hypothetical protein